MADVKREALIQRVRSELYRARWVDAFGKNSVMPTDQRLAEIVVDAVLQSEEQQ